MSKKSPIIITSLEELAEAAKQRRAVVIPDHPAWCKPKPASILFHLPGAVLLRMFRLGSMQIYEKMED